MTYEEYPRHDIKKETRSRNVLYRSKTRRKICEYIYEQTGCEKCRKGEFCSRDGDKWGCLPYNNIAQQLNHIGWATSRGNIGKWNIKTIRDQITWGLRELTEQEKQKRVEKLNQQRNASFVWDYHEFTEGTEQMLVYVEDKFGSVDVPIGSDVDSLLDNLKEVINGHHKQGKDVSILHVPREQKTYQ
jgi:hypothetical protein